MTACIFFVLFPGNIPLPGIIFISLSTRVNKKQQEAIKTIRKHGLRIYMTMEKFDVWVETLDLIDAICRVFY